MLNNIAKLIKVKERSNSFCLKATEQKQIGARIHAKEAIKNLKRAPQDFSSKIICDVFVELFGDLTKEENPVEYSTESFLKAIQYIVATLYNLKDFREDAFEGHCYVTLSAVMDKFLKTPTRR